MYTHTHVLYFRDLSTRAKTDYKIVVNVPKCDVSTSRITCFN